MMHRQFIRNPILPGFHPDPSICRVGNDYYIATSTFEWFPGVSIHHSRDLVNWRLLTHALGDTRLLDLRGVPSSGGVWAPALSFQDGLFYLCYTVVHQHESATKDTPNYLITAPDIHGPWSDPLFINSSGFDPSLFHDDDGKKYWLNMVWDHRSHRHPFHGINLQQFDAQKKELIETPQTIFTGSPIRLTEGPHLYKRNDWYYLLTAEGGTEYDHAVTMARSKNLYGPYEVHPKNPILTSAGKPDSPLQKAGHASLVETSTGEWYMPHLCARPLPGSKYCNLGRETAIQKVEWLEDEWLYLEGGGNSPSETVTPPQLPPCPWDKSPDRLPFDSIHYMTPRLRSKYVVRHPEKLQLYGAESLESCFEQALVARRLTHQRMVVTTKMTFKPQSFQQMAGLVAYYNTYLFHYIYLSWEEHKGRCLHIHSCDDGVSSFPLGEDIPVVPDGAIYLRAIFIDRDLRFAWSEDGIDFHDLPITLDSSILSDDHGKHWGFTGTFVGVCCQDLSGQHLKAEFNFLEMQPQ